MQSNISKSQSRAEKSLDIEMVLGVPDFNGNQNTSCKFTITEFETGKHKFKELKRLMLMAGETN
jgi:hypothetical protein